ncbi:hypothetical protein CPB86DRAFT_778098 [Serendipita vermifera]|nr:hypothetical protein CPB86DRAFT_778098 [Serendipita vermifera]
MTEPVNQTPVIHIQAGTPLAKDVLQNPLAIQTSPDAATSATSLTPSTRIATVINNLQELVQSPTTALGNPETGNIIIKNEQTGEVQELSVDELRRSYEDEEVNRFLRVFARQVHSVQMPQELPPSIPGKDDVVPSGLAVPTKEEPEADSENDEEEWRLEQDTTTSIPAIISQTVSSPVAAVSNAASVVTDTTMQTAQTIKEQSTMTYTLLNEGHWSGRSPTEYVAMEWIVPYLPRPHRKTYTFTFGGLQGTVTRLYLACQPLYAPFMLRMWSLMTWEYPRRSFLYCVLFWVLWFFDLLMPALFARLFFSLLRRRLMPYPTAMELIERRIATAQADIMGAEIRSYLDANISGGVGLKDAWRVFRLATKNKKQKAKEFVEDTTGNSVPGLMEDGLKEDENSKRAALAIMEEIADFHERFANLCHWRDPEASMRYTIVLAVMVIVTLFTPVKYVVKGIYACGGAAFWFVPNLWMALPVEHRSRIPPPLGDVPTDAEYAMNIISQRVERGEPVLPSKKKDKKRNSNLNLNIDTKSTYSLTPSATKSATSLTSFTGENEETPSDEGREKGPMKKLKSKVKNVVLVDQQKRQESLDENGEPLPEETFPAKYHAQMGMISLTPSALLFYPMMSSNAKVTIPLQDIRGVKKAGRMGGIRIKYAVKDESTSLAPITSNSPRQSMDDRGSILAGLTGKNAAATDAVSINATAIPSALNGEPLEREEKFGWVSGRDVLFAKLVGWGGRRWVKL